MSEPDPMDNLAQQVIRGLANLPPEEMETAVLDILNSVTAAMSSESLRDMVDEIRQRPDLDCELTRMTVDMIDGKLALREIGGGK